MASVTADQDIWTKGEWSAMNKPAGPAKATVAAVTAIIRPGMTTQVSIAQQAWITEQTIANTDFRLLDTFLTKLFF